MTVLPGSLDYLYYNGILDHIPYEAYEMGPATASGMGYNQMNGSQYLNQAMQGSMYNTYTNPDTFVRRNSNEYRQGEDYSLAQQTFGINDGIGKDSDLEVKAFGDEGKSFRETIVNGAKSTGSSFLNAPNFIKGLVSGALIIGTLFCLLKGKKKAPIESIPEKTSFWSKMNPKNWFKK